MIKNLTSSQLKILYIYGFFSVFLYIYMHNFIIYDFFLFLFFFFLINILEIETLLIVLINFFSSIINKFVSLFLFIVEYFIKTTLLHVCFYSLFFFSMVLLMSRKCNFKSMKSNIWTFINISPLWFVRHQLLFEFVLFEVECFIKATIHTIKDKFLLFVFVFYGSVYE